MPTARQTIHVSFAFMIGFLYWIFAMSWLLPSFAPTRSQLIHSFPDPTAAKSNRILEEEPAALDLR